MSYAITCDSDVFLYFEVIERSEPDSIIDMGMFLERIGALSRSVKDKSISDDIILEAFVGKYQNILPIYRTVYNRIYNTLPEKRYDISVLMRPYSLFDTSEIKLIAKWIQKHSKLVLVDSDSYEELKTYIGDSLVRILSSGDNNYYLITFGV